MASTTDVAGRKRIGMFEQVEDSLGNTFEQTSGRGNIAQFKTQTGGTFVANTANNANGLRHLASEVGAVPEPTESQYMDMFSPQVRKTL